MMDLTSAPRTARCADAVHTDVTGQPARSRSGSRL